MFFPGASLGWRGSGRALCGAALGWNGRGWLLGRPGLGLQGAAGPTQSAGSPPAPWCRGAEWGCGLWLGCPRAVWKNRDQALRVSGAAAGGCKPLWIGVWAPRSRVAVATAHTKLGHAQAAVAAPIPCGLAPWVCSAAAPLSEADGACGAEGLGPFLSGLSPSSTPVTGKAP